MKDSDETNGEELCGFHWNLYGYENKFKKEEFMEKIATEENCNWILHPEKIRLRLKPFMKEENLAKI